MAKTEYTVVTFSDLQDTISQVNHLANDGWKPTGGIAILRDVYGTTYLQSLVREVKEFKKAASRYDDED